MLVGLPRALRDIDSTPFWQACDEGRLVLPRCGRCGRFRWPPGPICPGCRMAGAEWVDSPGRGTVYSWVVVHVPFAEALVDQLPYAVGLIQLAEGVRLVSTIEGCDPAAIEAGMPVVARFEDAGVGRRMLTFVPSEAGSA